MQNDVAAYWDFVNGLRLTLAAKIDPVKHLIKWNKNPAFLGTEKHGLAKLKISKKLFFLSKYFVQKKLSPMEFLLLLSSDN